MSSTDDRFLGLDQDDSGIHTQEDLAALIGDVNVAQAKAEEKPKITPKVLAPKVENSPTDKVAAKQEKQEDTDDVKILNAKIRDMEAAIALLTAGRDNIKLRAAVAERKPVDWNKIVERDIFDLNCPIDIVDHQMPDYMNVEAVDSNFVLRWVQKMPRRLGPMKAMGYQFCVKEDIKGELNIAIEENVNGQFAFDDVILMKIEKRLYYGMLRKNHERAIKMVDPKAAHKTAKERVIADMRTSTDGAGEYDKRAAANQLDVYSPYFDI